MDTNVTLALCVYCAGIIVYCIAKVTQQELVIHIPLKCAPPTSVPKVFPLNADGKFDVKSFYAVRRLAAWLVFHDVC